MQNIDLLTIVREWQNTPDGNGASGNPTFTGVKVKLSNVDWGTPHPRNKQIKRAFELKNSSPQAGQAHLSAVKESRPVVTVKILSGVLEGYSRRKALRLPPSLMSTLGEVVMFDVGQRTTQLIDPSRLEVDAEVQLPQSDSKVATMEDSSISCTVKFFCTATMEGSVIFGHSSQIDIEQIMEDKKKPVSWSIDGVLEVNFEDNHTLSLQ